MDDYGNRHSSAANRQSPIANPRIFNSIRISLSRILITKKQEKTKITERIKSCLKCLKNIPGGSWRSIWTQTCSSWSWRCPLHGDVKKLSILWAHFLGGYNRSSSPALSLLLRGCWSRRGSRSRRKRPRLLLPPHLLQPPCLLRPPHLLRPPLIKEGRSRPAEVFNMVK